MSARALNWAFEQQPKSASNKLVLIALADRADEDGECFPSVDWIATKCAPMAAESVRRNLRELAEQGLVEKAERRRRTDGTLGTWIYRLPVETTGHERTVDPPVASERADLVSLTESSEARASESPKPVDEAVKAVTDVWMAHAPPLIQHRPAWLASRSTRAVIVRKLAIYDSAVIAEAIANYATVLAGPEWMWTHSWTITDFLNRGLDRFVPEARPLENFRRRGEKFGRRDVSGREFSDLADRLESEQRREIESGTG